jgi:uncharacterized membrane protein YphA (DoxX/SURF4 family)
MPASRSIIHRLDGILIPLPVLLRIFLGGYFIRAGVNKVLDPFVFLKAIRLYDMLPETPAVFLNSVAIVLPWLEIICGVALVLGVFIRGAGALIAAMVGVFTPAIFLRALAVMGEEGISFFKVEFDCGCGTGSDIIWLKLCTNTGLLLLAILAILSRSRRFTLAALLDRLRTRPAH